MRFRKKPVEIEAHAFTRDLLGEGAKNLAKWCGGKYTEEAKTSDPTDVARWIEIPTLEGNMRALPGDWIIRGAQGEFYPCKPEIFAETYEAVESWEPPYDEFADPQRQDD